MNIRNQLLCAHSTLLFVILTAVGLFIMPGWIPPPSPATDSMALARMFSDNAVLRAGLAIGAFVSPFFMGLPAAITAQLRRIEGQHHVLADLQLVCAAVGVLAIQFPAFFWLAISYRPDTFQPLIVVFNDLSWFLLLGAAGPAILQNLSIGFAILGDGSGKNIYPRWLGYWNIWLAILLMPGILIPFFKRGPFAWNGIMSFWVVFTAFFFWMLLNYVYTVKAIHRQRADETA